MWSMWSDTPLLRAALEYLEVIGPKNPPTKRKWVMLRRKITNFLDGLTLKNTPLNRHPSLTASSNPRLGPPCRGPEGKKYAMPRSWDHPTISGRPRLFDDEELRSLPWLWPMLSPGNRSGYSRMCGDCASVWSLPSASTARVLEGIAPNRSTHRCFYM
jgi:hypothetical protein